jgi:copper chaperone
MQSPQNESTKIEPRALTLAVEGMSCGHCKLAITDEVSQVSGVKSVEVDLDTKLVRVRGTDVDEAAVVSAIDEAGYEAVAA